MKKLSFYGLILLVLSIFSVGIGQTNSDNSDFSTEEVSDPEFLDSLRFSPVKFTKQEDDYLKAEFPSKNETAILSFKFLPDNRGRFYKFGKGSNEQISRDQFLKKMKTDLWWVVYRSVGEENYIYQAFQIRTLADLQASYPYDPYDNYQRVENYQFWQAMRIINVEFYNFDRSTNKLSWLFLKSIDPIKDPSIYSEWVSITDNYDKAVQKLKLQNPGKGITTGAVSRELGLPMEHIFLKLATGEISGNLKVIRNDTSISLIMRQDVFELNPYCVFNIITDNGQKKSVDRKFFESNFNKYTWTVFYNPESKIALRMVAMRNDPK